MNTEAFIEKYVRLLCRPEDWKLIRHLAASAKQELQALPELNEDFRDRVMGELRVALGRLERAAVRKRLTREYIAPIYRQPIDRNRLPNVSAFDRVDRWRPTPPTDYDEQAYAAWIKAGAPARGLLCHGRSGAGKTRSTFHRIMTLFDDGVIDEFAAYNSAELARRIRTLAYGDRDGYDSFLDEMKGVDLLFLDDLHQMKWTPAVAEFVFQVTEHRTSHGLAIITTVQVSQHSLAHGLITKLAAGNQEVIEQAGAVVRRLLEFSDIIDFDAEKPC